MALPIITNLVIGQRKIADFNNLVIQQPLFGHHQLRVDIPFDVLEGSQQGFLVRAHQELVAQPVTVSFEAAVAPSPGRFTFKGVVTQLEVGTRGDLTGAFSLLALSPTCLLAEVPRYRTFRNKSLADIFRTVLGAYPGNALASRLKPVHGAALRYVVQYGESDFVFLHRLAAQHGEWLYYDGSTFCLGRPTEKALPFEADGVRAACQLRLGVQAPDFAVAQYQPGRHELLHASSGAQGVSWVGQHPLTAFAAQASADLYPEAGLWPAGTGLDTQPALARYVAQRKSQQAAQLVTCSGWGENPGMGLGRPLAITGKGLGTLAATAESFGNYLLTSITHVVEQDNYHNVFEAVPSSAEHPPLNPHVAPPMGLPELAEVIDLKDPQHLGRLRLRYLWPVAKPADAETDWVRMTTPYSGHGKGQLFNPELGSQVLVGYEKHQAEAPVVLGNLMHANNKQGAKYTTPENHLKGIQTAGGNKVVMSDKKGAQTILLSNSNNKGTAVEVGFKGDGSITIKSNGPVTVLSPDITLEAGKKGAVKLHGKNITIEAEENLDLKSGKKLNAKTLDLKAEADNSVAISAKNSAKLAGTVKTDLEGGLVGVTGQQLVDVKGLIVKINS